MINIPEELEELSNLFGEDELYIVGGYVRDSLMGIEAVGDIDIDLCSSVNLIDKKEFLQTQGFLVVSKNEKIGSFAIIKNNLTFEYTRLRKDTYQKLDKHSPTKVEFVNTIEEDVLRRDFSINSIYYSIKKKCIYDFFGGQKDIKMGIVRAIGTPEDVFSVDPVRILRMVRFAVCLNFEIDENTFLSAKNNISNLKGLSNSWKDREITSILNYKSRNNDSIKRVSAMKELFSKLGAESYIS